MGFLIDNLLKKTITFFYKKGQDVISHKLVFHKKSHDVNGFLKQDMYLLPDSFFLNSHDVDNLKQFFLKKWLW